MPNPDRTKDKHGRDLPDGYLRCTTRDCGPVHDTFPKGAEHKSCSSKGGSCKQGGCACYLFRHERGRAPHTTMSMRASASKSLQTQSHQTLRAAPRRNKYQGRFNLCSVDA